MNKITIFGRLTKDVELTSSASGKDYGKFGVASVSKRKDANGERKTDFFDCVIFGNGAKVVADYFKKGDQILVIGQMESKKVEDKIYWNVIVEDFDFVSGRKSESKEPVEASEEEVKDLPF